MQLRQRFLHRILPSLFVVVASIGSSGSSQAQSAVFARATAPVPSAPLPSTYYEPQFYPGAPLTLHDRFVLEVHATFGPSAYLVPAGEAAKDVAFPPSAYPRNWRDGGGAFARNYGAEFARHTTGGMAHFATAALLREDPRYYPARSTNPFARIIHALAFTFVDRSDSGHRTLAVSNLAGSAAAGFIGMAYYPPGYNDTAHSLQRAEWETTTFASHNLIAEFAPEIYHVAHLFHFPSRMADSLLPADRRQP